MNRRLPAEWENQSAVQITFPHSDTDWKLNWDDAVSCFSEIISTISMFEPVLVICMDQENVKKNFRGDKDNLILVTCESNDTWARDHGALTVLDNDNPVLLDFEFNGWGGKYPAGKDNLITRQLKDLGVFGETAYSRQSMVLEGGSIESDGNGTLLTTENCLLNPNRNPGVSKESIESQLKEIFGLKQVLWLKHGLLQGDDTDSHIDTLVRFCSNDTIAYVGCEDEKDQHYEELRKMEEEVEKLKQLNGRPYRLIKLPFPDPIFNSEGDRLPATYANFLIINDALLVPIYGVDQDKTALDLLASTFPERKVIGLNCKPLIQQFGSLHCISMQYPGGVVNSGSNTFALQVG